MSTSHNLCSPVVLMGAMVVMLVMVVVVEMVVMVVMVVAGQAGQTAVEGQTLVYKLQS